MTISSKYHPPKLPPYSELPAELRPTLARIYSLQSQNCALGARQRKWLSALERLKREREELEKEALDLEISLWDALGKITVCKTGPGTVQKFKPTIPAQVEEDITPEAAAIKALKKLSDEERESLIADILEQKMTANKEDSL